MITITLANGGIIQWSRDEYTDCCYDAICFNIYRGEQIVGLYNMEYVQMVEVEE